MENESMTLTTEVLKKYISPVFVETGSYDGRTIQQALDVGFEHVVSVEVDPRYAQICRERFADNPMVEIWEGDSLDVLWHMIENINKPITYWLDAHIQDGTKLGRKRVPLLDELSIISQHPTIQESIIMIDDKRLFGTPNNDWEVISENVILNMLACIISNSTITFEDSRAAPGDIIVAKKGLQV